VAGCHSTQRPKDDDYGKCQQIRRLALHQSGAKLSLNATSVGVLIRDIGDDFDAWVGFDVQVYAGEVDTKSGRADAVLVRLIDGNTPTPAAPQKATAKADMDDEIPFS
jgi:hypothetical protein